MKFQGGHLLPTFSWRPRHSTQNEKPSISAQSLQTLQLVYLVWTWQNDALSIFAASEGLADSPALIVRAITVDGSTEVVQGGTVYGRLFGRFPGL